MGNVLNRAINPHQYDLPDTGWPYHGVGLDSPLTRVFWEYLLPYTSEWKNKDLLDVGAGTGWMLNEAYKLGVKSAIGLEPAKRNIEIAKKYFPKIKMEKTMLESFVSKKKFDYITAIMSLNHVLNIDFAFKKLSSLLKNTGKLQTIIPDYDYFNRKRHGYNIKFEKISSKEFACMVTRPDFGTLADLVRKVSIYQTAGEKYDLKLVENKSMIPTIEWMEQYPRFKKMENVTLWHLVIFKKQKL
ncbi:class I SAM-dependent methyltransferase [Candidatus Gottesmanbacteria bacterium]|nr:class I SAM-dependent methyltransferase [Candidatus Gottesmanbacteria bacterium]